MTPDDLKQLEASLWEAADQLRANSKLNAAEYSMPVLGLIFLRHASNRFEAAKAKIEASRASRGGRRRELVAADFESRAAMFLADEARYDYLAGLPEGRELGVAIDDAMRLIEAQVPAQLEGVLPKDYAKLDQDLLAELVRIFNRDELRSTTDDDLFGRIYEYFLDKFAMTGAQEGGEFFTPPSLVRTIVNFIEPTHGTILDPACGSGGMFVQAAHALAEAGQHGVAELCFHGREKSETNARLARMNLAVHGLEGDIRQGNSFYDRWPELIGQCDFVLANPPFNVDMVDPLKIADDPRLFTEKKIPGISSKTKSVGNANYLWIQYFYAYLNDRGRAGFVMPQSATDAGYAEKTLRRQILATRDVDIIVAIGTHFFYTRTLPCSLWFFDRGRPEPRRDEVLMLDARNIHRAVNRKIREFSDEQIANLTAIVWLYRGEQERYLGLVGRYFAELIAGLVALRGELETLDGPVHELTSRLEGIVAAGLEDTDVKRGLSALLVQRGEAIAAFEVERAALLDELEAWAAGPGAGAGASHGEQRALHASFLPFVPRLTALRKHINEVHRLSVRAVDHARKQQQIREHTDALDQARHRALEAVRALTSPFAQVTWLSTRFPEARIAEVPGLCKVVTLDEIASRDYSLTPGRYVGVAAPEPEDAEHVEDRLRAIHSELAALDEQATALTATILANFEGLIG